jgi:5-hydroxytryptamine receptor 1
VFVIAAILLDRHLQSVANYLILSLAVADLLVALLVMPLGAVYEVSPGIFKQSMGAIGTE